MPTFITARTRALLCATALPALLASVERAAAQTVDLPAISVSGPAGSGTGSAPTTPPIKDKFQLPQISQSITAETIRERVNAVDTEDVIKYFPSLFVRKRNNGDTQPVLATRTWGLNSSARSLVYADDLLLSALIANNNSIGAPRWGLVTPEEIDRVDFLYGPFAAAYPGNSIGGVLQITTKMPDKPFVSATQTEAFQTFNRYYGTKDTYRTDQTNLAVGSRTEDLSWLITGNYQNSYSQPLTFITNGSIPANTTGTFPALNKLGQVANVVGAGGLLHTEMGNVKGKVAWDITPWLTATYQIGLWTNNTESSVQTYLKDRAGGPTFAGLSGFASNTYTLRENHLSNALSLKTDTKGVFDWDLSLSNYYYLQDIQRSPYSVLATGTSYTPNGKIARLDGTNWTNGDLKGIWRPDGPGGAHEVSFGLHADRYVLNNPTLATPTWDTGPSAGTALYTSGKGVTTTEALWVQDAWRFAPDFKLTLGSRFESWRASDGFNLQTSQTSLGVITSTTAQKQPGVESTGFSPKVSLSWTPSPEWEVTGSFGQANRFPTVSELYQIVSTGSTFAIPNPNLKPEAALSEEIAVQRKFADGSIRLSVFNENVRDALISQTGYLSGQTIVSFVTNVQAIRNTGVELAAQKDNVVFDGLTLFGSVTYVDSRILKDPSWVSATGTAVVGKHVPYVPDWRATFGATYHPTDRWALTAAARYSGKQYSTLDNIDVIPHVYGAFDSFFVVDTRAQYKLAEQATINVGIDNLFNTKYTLFHPFPGRTYSAQVRVQF